MQLFDDIILLINYKIMYINIRPSCNSCIYPFMVTSLNGLV